MIMWIVEEDVESLKRYIFMLMIYMQMSIIRWSKYDKAMYQSLGMYLDHIYEQYPEEDEEC